MQVPTKFFTAAALVGLMFTTGCKKDDPEVTPVTPAGPAYSVPTTYNGFTNVDHTESTSIIGMLSELSTAIAAGTGTTGSTTPSPLSAAHLNDMFTNQNNPFTTSSYNTSGYQIKNNCILVSQTELQSFLDSLVVVSNTTTTASNGVAGLGLSLDSPPKRYLLTANGVNYSQIFFKHIMGDLILYQITTRVANNTLDNTTHVAGQNYTAMEHNWDEAFGYWSVPDSFPAVLTPVKYWGSYSNQVNGGLGCNAIVMNAFLKGRAAISNNDMATKDAQAAIIIAEFDKMTAGGVIRELNEIQQSLTAGDATKIVTQLSECKGFVMSMQNNMNAGRVITNAQIATLLSYFPTNNWNVTTADLANIKTYIASVYGFTAAQLAAM